MNWVSTMSDAYSIIKAMRIGYDLIQDEDGLYWHRKNDKMEGPFPSIDDAARNAIIDHEYEQGQQNA
jgi:hypothetical protein